MRVLRKSTVLRLAALVTAVTLSVGGSHYMAQEVERYADRYPELLEETQPILSARDGIPWQNWDIEADEPSPPPALLVSTTNPK